MGSGLVTAAAVIPAPSADEISVTTVGTTATTAIDLYEALGIVSSTGAPAPTSGGRFKITVTASGGDVGILFGDASVAAPSISATDSSSPSSKCALVPDGTSRVFDVRDARRYVRMIASAASTRAEIARG